MKKDKIETGVVLEFNVDPNTKKINFVGMYYIPEFNDISILSFLATYLSSRAIYPVKSIIIENHPIDSFEWTKKLKEFIEKQNYKVTSEDVYIVDIFFENLPFETRFIIFEVEI